MKKRLQHKNVLIASLAAVLAGVNLLVVGLYGFFVLKSEAQYIAWMGVIFLPLGVGYFLTPRDRDCSRAMVNCNLLFLVTVTLLNTITWKIWWMLIVLALEVISLLLLEKKWKT